MRNQVTSCYSRWDSAWRSMYASSRRRKHLLSVSEDFESARDGVLRWLADVNERLGATWRLTDELRGNNSAALQEIAELQDLNRELAYSSQRMVYIEKAGNYLIQKCEPTDSVLTQQHLDEFTFIRQQVENKIKRCLEKLSCPDESSIASDSSSSSSMPQKKYAVHVNLANTSASKYTPKKTRRTVSTSESVVGDKELSTIKKALERATKQITDSETLLRCNTPIGPEAIELPVKHYELSVKKCEESLKDLKNLEEAVKLSKNKKSIVGVDTRIKSLLQRWRSVLERAELKDQRLKMHCDQWNKLKKDLVRLTKWLDEVEIKLRNESQPSSLREIEISTRDYVDFNSEISSWKSLVLSMNIMKNELKENNKLRSRLADINRRWDRVNASVSCRRLELGVVLTHCVDFSETLRELLSWLDATEKQLDCLLPVNYINGGSTLRRTNGMLKDVRVDLERSHQQIEVLREMSELLLTDPKIEKAVHSRDQLNIITNRYNALRKICDTNMDQIEMILHTSNDSMIYNNMLTFEGTHSAEHENNDPADVGNAKSKSFCCLLIAFLLLSTLLAALVIGLLWPECDDMNSAACFAMNTHKYSFNVQLTHVNGPPPS